MKYVKNVKRMDIMHSYEYVMLRIFMPHLPNDLLVSVQNRTYAISNDEMLKMRQVFDVRIKGYKINNKEIVAVFSVIYPGIRKSDLKVVLGWDLRYEGCVVSSLYSNGIQFDIKKVNEARSNAFLRNFQRFDYKSKPSKECNRCGAIVAKARRHSASVLAHNPEECNHKLVMSVMEE